MTPVDGASRLLSPLGDSRHRAVRCLVCRHVETWAASAVCDDCYEVEARAYRALTGGAS